jgi:hypothetical protein
MRRLRRGEEEVLFWEASVFFSVSCFKILRSSLEHLNIELRLRGERFLIEKV